MVADRLAAAHEFLTALSLDGSTNLTDTNEKRPNSQGSPTVNISKREEKREDEILSYSSSSFISFPIDRHHTPKKKSESYKYLLKPYPKMNLKIYYVESRMVLLTTIRAC